jgi:hypothetical protein
MLKPDILKLPSSLISLNYSTRRFTTIEATPSRIEDRGAREKRMIPDGKRLERAEPATRTADIVQNVVSTVEPDIISGLQPDVREIRMLMADVRHLTSLAFKRIFRIMLALLVVNALTLIVVVSLLF